MKSVLNALYSSLESPIDSLPIWLLYVIDIAFTTIMIALAASLIAFLALRFMPGPEYYFDVAVRRGRRLQSTLRERNSEDFMNFAALGTDVVSWAERRSSQRKARSEQQRSERAVVWERALRAFRQSVESPPAVAEQMVSDEPEQDPGIAEEAKRQDSKDEGSVDEQGQHPPDYSEYRRPGNESLHVEYSPGASLNRVLDEMFAPTSESVRNWQIRVSCFGFRIRRGVQILLLPLGGYLLGSLQKPLRWPRSIFRFWAILFATIIVIWARPPDNLWTNLDEAWQSVWMAVEGTTPTRLLPLLLLILAVLLFARRGPLIDQIRARDEAAKEANKLLAQLLGQLIPLSVELRDSWCRAVRRMYWLELKRFVHDASDGYMVMEDRAIVPQSLSTYKFESRRYKPLESQSIVAAVARIGTIQQELIDKGLVSVAAALTKPRYLHIREVGLLPIWSYPLTDRLESRLCVPEFLNRRRQVNEIGAKQAGMPLQSTSSRPALEDFWEHFAQFAAELDLFATRVRVAQYSIDMTISYLERRIGGKWWLQMLGIVAK